MAGYHDCGTYECQSGADWTVQCSIDTSIELRIGSSSSVVDLLPLWNFRWAACSCACSLSICRRPADFIGHSCGNSYHWTWCVHGSPTLSEGPYTNSTTVVYSKKAALTGLHKSLHVQRSLRCSMAHVLLLCQGARILWVEELTRQQSCCTAIVDH